MWLLSHDNWFKYLRVTLGSTRCYSYRVNMSTYPVLAGLVACLQHWFCPVVVSTGIICLCATLVQPEAAITEFMIDEPRLLVHLPACNPGFNQVMLVQDWNTAYKKPVKPVVSRTGFVCLVTNLKSVYTIADGLLKMSWWDLNLAIFVWCFHRPPWQLKQKVLKRLWKKGRAAWSPYV